MRIKFTSLPAVWPRIIYRLEYTVAVEVQLPVDVPVGVSGAKVADDVEFLRPLSGSQVKQVHKGAPRKARFSRGWPIIQLASENGAR